MSKKMSLAGGVLVLVVASSLFVWYTRSKSTALPSAPEGITRPIQTQGVIIRDVVVGQGWMVPPDNTDLALDVTYTGSYSDGTIFDSAHSQNPYTLIPGATDTPVGWDKGLVGMQIGGTRIIMVTPDYPGRAQLTDTYPEDKTIIYQVRLLGITDYHPQGEGHSGPAGAPHVQPGL